MTLKLLKRGAAALLAAALALTLTACGGTPDDTAVIRSPSSAAESLPPASPGGSGPAASAPEETSPEADPAEEPELLDPDGAYTSAEDVSVDLETYGELPSNFITKKEARALGWSGGSLEPYAPGKCIGGDRFGNYEGLLPEDREYRECDIDTLGAESRGAKRLVFSEDGLIYYTEDHYESFTLLYGEE